MEKRIENVVPVDRSVVLPFIIFVVLVGAAPVAMRISFMELAPFFVGFARYFLGGAFFLLLALIKKMPLPRGRALLGASLYGILGFGFTFLLLGWGLVKTPASLGAVLLALLPLMTIFLSAIQGVEPLTIRGVVGALVAISGTIVIVGGASASDISIPHIAAIIVGTAFSAQASVIVKRFPRNHPILTNAVAMSIGGSMLGVASLIAGETWLIPTLTNTWIALGYLILPVSILAFFLYTVVLNKWTASATSYAFVLLPIITVIVAVVLGGEVITLEFLIGTLLVLLGVFIGVLMPGKKKAVIDRQLEDCMPC